MCVCVFPYRVSIATISSKWQKWKSVWLPVMWTWWRTTALWNSLYITDEEFHLPHSCRLNWTKTAFILSTNDPNVNCLPSPITLQHEVTKRIVLLQCATIICIEVDRFNSCNALNCQLHSKNNRHAAMFTRSIECVSSVDCSFSSPGW